MEVELKGLHVWSSITTVHQEKTANFIYLKVFKSITIFYFSDSNMALISFTCMESADFVLYVTGQ